ncbi:hypothetical protein DFH06DRAFT_1145900 [Mycena polygramma]|nr:hypothetical protein DFH06DRAFT_1145900 [Mycena polygramma]
MPRRPTGFAPDAPARRPLLPHDVSPSAAVALIELPCAAHATIPEPARARHLLPGRGAPRIGHGQLTVAATYMSQGRTSSDPHPPRQHDGARPQRAMLVARVNAPPGRGRQGSGVGAQLAYGRPPRDHLVWERAVSPTPPIAVDRGRERERVSCNLCTRPTSLPAPSPRTHPIPAHHPVRPLLALTKGKGKGAERERQRERTEGAKGKGKEMGGMGRGGGGRGIGAAVVARRSSRRSAAWVTMQRVDKSAEGRAEPLPNERTRGARRARQGGAVAEAERYRRDQGGVGQAILAWACEKGLRGVRRQWRLREWCGRAWIDAAPTQRDGRETVLSSVKHRGRRATSASEVQSRLLAKSLRDDWDSGVERFERIGSRLVAATESFGAAKSWSSEEGGGWTLDGRTQHRLKFEKVRGWWQEARVHQTGHNNASPLYSLSLDAGHRRVDNPESGKKKVSRSDL